MKLIKKFFLPFLVVIVFFFLLVAAIYELAYTGKIYPGVKIGPVDVGNKTPEEAEKILATLVKQNLKTLEIFHPQKPEKKFLLEPQEIRFAIEEKPLVQEAYLVGRQGNILGQAQQKKEAWRGEISLPLKVEFNAELLQAKVATMAAEVFVPPLPPTINFKNGEVLIDPGQSGEELDQRQLQEKIIKRFSNLNFDPLPLPLRITNPPPTDEEVKKLKEKAQGLMSKEIVFKQGEETIDRWNGEKLISTLRFSAAEFEEKIKEEVAILATKTNTEPQNALFEFKDNRVAVFKPSRPGRKLKEEETFSLIKENLEKLAQNEEKSLILELPIFLAPPLITTENVNDLGIRELLGEGVSYFRGSTAGRAHNITLASSKLNGQLLGPGETFSFNAALGEVSAATGYQPAYIIKEGRTVLGDGGGVCQVSTTLFRAALNAGLPILERQAHAYRVSYYEQESFAGLDATVYSPKPDLRVQNDTPAYILFQAQVFPKEFKLVFQLYGTADGRQAAIANPRLWDQVAPPPPLYIDDPTLPKGEVRQVEAPVWGAKAAFDWKVVRDGQVLQERTFYSSYQPWQAVYLKGTKE
ncbi:VanW family protein [Candidatus Shapirobacteria bacterium]|nr:VanW family protein [Candidatus Shapirobacteria bacterium]